MKKIIISLSFLLLLCFALTCFADNEFAISDSYYEPNSRQLSVIVNDNRANSGSPAVLAEITVNDTKLEDTTLVPLADSNIPVTYCFVVDTSSTALITQERVANTLASELAQKHTNTNARFILISFNKNGASLVGSGRYTNSLFSKLDYKVGGEGDGSAALNMAIQELNGERTFSKKVIVLISDGYWVSNPYLETDQLLNLVQESGYPVFSWGMAVSEETSTGSPWKYNRDYLTQLEDLSGTTGGKYVSYKTDEHPANLFYNQIFKSNVVTGKFPQSYGQDAGFSKVSVNLQFRNGTEIGVTQPSIQVNLPKIDPVTVLTAEVLTETPEVIVPEEPEVIPTAAPEGFAAKMEKALGENWKLILVAGVLAIVLIVLIILTITNNKKKENTLDVDVVKPDDPDKGGGTEIIDPKSVKVRLTRLDNPSFKVIVDLQNGATQYFGRENKGDIIGLGGDSVISGRHFSLKYENDKVLLNDCQSTNHTYLVYGNERPLVTGPVQVRNGVVISAANIDFRINIS